jgi:hypothetical protein
MTLSHFRFIKLPAARSEHMTWVGGWSNAVKCQWHVTNNRNDRDVTYMPSNY